MSRDGDFLARWSRRKREAARAPAPAEFPSAKDRAASPASGSAGASPPEGPVAEAEISAEELARLPALDEVTGQTDLLQFLRKGVPEALRKAALRRIWALDPAIRDYVGDARDYADDWNVPGSMPGFGPLSPDTDVPAAVARIFGEPRDRSDTIGSETCKLETKASDAIPSPPEGAVSARAEPQSARHEGASLIGSGERGMSEAGSEARTQSREAPPDGTAVADEDDGPRRRRHGGAKPI